MFTFALEDLLFQVRKWSLSMYIRARERASSTYLTILCLQREQFYRTWVLVSSLTWADFQLFLSLAAPGYWRTQHNSDTWQILNDRDGNDRAGLGSAATSFFPPKVYLLRQLSQLCFKKQRFPAKLQRVRSTFCHCVEVEVWDVGAQSHTPLRCLSVINAVGRTSSCGESGWFNQLFPREICPKDFIIQCPKWTVKWKLYNPLYVFYPVHFWDALT